MTVGCGVAISCPQILSLPLPAFLKKGGMLRAVSLWYLVALKTSFTVRNIFQANDVFLVFVQPKLSCQISLYVGSKCVRLRVHQGVFKEMPLCSVQAQRS